MILWTLIHIVNIKAIFYQLIYKQKSQVMQLIDDPQNYETSNIVEKSSKTGLFSNKRLLVIRNGFLYYFSNVPKGYTKHVPNILDNLQELPKSSIEIKSIHTIKLESAKGSDLIIKFYQKDMIDREDIRKTLTNGGFQKSQKNTQDLQEWKFTFTTVLQCRLWYTALVKLKLHFNRQEDKIQQFFNNFDPTRRMSKAITSLSGLSNEDIKRKDSNLSQTKIQSKVQKKTQKPKQVLNLNPQQIKLPSSNQQPVKQKNEQTPKAQVKIEQRKEYRKEQQQKKVQYNIQIKPQTQRSRKISYELKTITQEDQDTKLRKMQQQIRKQIADQIRHQQRNRAQKHIQVYKSKIQEKQSQLISLQRKLQDQQKTRRLEKQQFVKSLRASPSRSLSPEKKKASVRQLSIQTEQQEKFDLKEKIQSPINQKKESVKNFKSVQVAIADKELKEQQNQKSDKQLRHSAITQLENPKRQTIDTINIFSNTISYIPPKTFRLSQKQQQSYDFYGQLGLLYQKQAKFEQQSKRQIQMIKYISHLKREASQIFQKYITQSNPQKCLTIQRGKFQLQIIWQSGKIVNLQEDIDKLVFQSKQHRNVKRKWKLYNFLQNRLINILKKKPQFNLRLPLCFHGQYCGYSALIQVLPNCRSNPELKSDSSIQKQLSTLVDPENCFRYSIKEIKNRSKQLYLVQIGQPYKITSMDETIPIAEYSYDIPSLIKSCRRSNNSSCIQKIQKQILKRTEGNQQKQTKQKEDEIINLQYIRLCRELKNLFRSTESQSIIDGSFFKVFLQSPEPVISLLSDELGQYWQNISDNPRAQLLSYLNFFFGIHMAQDTPNLDVMSNIENLKIQHFPVLRQYDLQKTSVVQISSNFQKYLKQGKRELIETSLSYIREIEQDPIRIQLCQVSLMIQNGQVANGIQKLLSIKKMIPYADLRFIKCSAFLIQCYQKCNLPSHMLKQLSQAMDYTDFMFGKSSNQKAFLYLLTAELLIKQNKVQQGIRVYKELLQRYTSVISKEDLYLSLTKSLIDNRNADPDHLIEFINGFMGQRQSQNQNRSRNDQEYFIKQEATIQDPKNQKQADLYKHLGCLYKSSKSNQKAAAYLEPSLKYYIQKLDSQSENLNSLESIQHWKNIIQTGIELSKCYINPQSRLKTYIDLIQVSNHLIKQNQKKNPNAMLSVGIENAIKNLYTAYFCQIVSLNLDQSQQEVLRSCINAAQSNSTQGTTIAMPISREVCLKEEQIRFIISQTMHQKSIPFEFNRQFFSCLNLKSIQSLLITM